MLAGIQSRLDHLPLEWGLAQASLGVILDEAETSCVMTRMFIPPDQIQTREFRGGQEVPQECERSRPLHDHFMSEWAEDAERLPSIDSFVSHSLAMHESVEFQLPEHEHCGDPRATMASSDTHNLGSQHPANWRYNEADWASKGWKRRLARKPWFQCISQDKLSQLFAKFADRSRLWNELGYGFDLLKAGYLVIDVVFYPQLHSLVVDNKVGQFDVVAYAVVPLGCICFRSAIVSTTVSSTTA